MTKAERQRQEDLRLILCAEIVGVANFVRQQIDRNAMRDEIATTLMLQYVEKYEAALKETV